MKPTGILPKFLPEPITVPELRGTLIFCCEPLWICWPWFICAWLICAWFICCWPICCWFIGWFVLNWFLVFGWFKEEEEDPYLQDCWVVEDIGWRDCWTAKLFPVWLFTCADWTIFFCDVLMANWLNPVTCWGLFACPTCPKDEYWPWFWVALSSIFWFYWPPYCFVWYEIW